MMWFIIYLQKDKKMVYFTAHFSKAHLTFLGLQNNFLGYKIITRCFGVLATLSKRMHFQCLFF